MRGRYMIKIAIKDPSRKYDCEGIRCTSYAVYQLKLTVQNIGIITLLLCEKCLCRIVKEDESI
jgi:hypothetical protein